MPTTPVYLLPGTLPYACYPSDPQVLNVDIITRVQAFLSEAFPGIYIGPTSNPPSASMRNRIWFNTDTPWWYQWVGGDWRRKYQFPAVSDPALPSVEFLWTGSESALNFMDGGDDDALGDYTGPLWAIDHLVDGRAIVGAGDIPGTDPAVNLSQGDTGGEYEHTLSAAEGAVSDHFHMLGLFYMGDSASISFPQTAVATVPSYTGRMIGGGGTDYTAPLTTADIKSLPSGSDGAGVTPTAHNNMQPYIARYIIRRTKRIWVTAPN